MKKVLCVLAVIAGLALCGCERVGSTTWCDYDYAYILLQDGTVVQGKIDSYRTYRDGDYIQITINGDIYLVHRSNATLIKRG